MKLKNIANISLNISMALINSIFVLPKIVIDINSNKKSLLLFFPIFMGAFAFLLQPTYEYDLYRIFEGYKTYVRGNEAFGDSLELYLPILYYFVSKFELSVHSIPLFSSVILYFTVAKLHYDNVRFSPSCIRYSRFLAFSLLFISIPFLLFSGIRFSTSLAVFLLGWHLYYRSIRTLGLSLIGLSFFFHFGMFLPIAIFCLSLFVKANYNRNFKILIILCSACFGLLSDTMIEFMISLVVFFNQFLGLSVDYTTYVTGIYGVERSASFNETGQLVFLIKQYGIIIILFLANFNLLKRRDSNATFLFYLFLFCLLTFNFASIFGRYSQLLTLLTFFVYFYDSSCRSNKLFDTFLLLFSFAYFIFFRLIEIKNNMSLISSSYSVLYDFSYLNIILDFWVN